MNSYWLRITMIVSAVSSLNGIISLEERMVHATKKGNLVELQDLMKKFEKSTMSSQEKKNVTSVVSATCLDLKDSARNSSLIESKKDFFSTFLGSVIAVTGLSYCIGGMQEIEGIEDILNNRSIFAQTGVGALATLMGGYFLVQGLRKVTLLNTYKTAGKIGDYLEYASWAIDFPREEKFV